MKTLPGTEFDTPDTTEDRRIMINTAIIDGTLNRLTRLYLIGVVLIRTLPRWKHLALKALVGTLIIALSGGKT